MLELVINGLSMEKKRCGLKKIEVENIFEMLK